MKFSIPFFGKRPADLEKRDLEQSSAGGASKQPLESLSPVEPDRKPFVVPDSADAMPSFSQPVELANIASASINANANTNAGDTLSPNQNTSPSPDHAAGSANAAAIPVPLVSEAIAQTVLAAAELPKQMESMLMSQEDIIAAYKIFLKRHPETMEVIKPRVGLTGDRVLVDFLSSSEFTSRPEVVNLIFALAKKLLDEQKAKATQEAVASPSTPAPENPAGGA